MDERMTEIQKVYTAEMQKVKGSDKKGRKISKADGNPKMKGSKGEESRRKIKK